MKNKTKNMNAYDSNSKLILSNKTVLCNFMKQCIPEYKNLSKQEIIKCIEDGDNNTHIKGINTESIGFNGEKIHYDILFTSRIPNSKEKIGMYINIEPQNKLDLNYELLNRAQFYAARLINRQKGEIFNKSNYDDIKKVYSIWICLNPKTEQKDAINLYTFNEINIKGNYHTKIDYHLIYIIMLYVGDNYNNDSKGLLQMLNLIFISSNSDSQWVKKLNNDYDKIVSEREASLMSNLSRGLIQQGFEEGMQQGAIVNAASNIKNLIDNLKISYDEAVNMLGIDESIRKDVLKAFKKKHLN